MVNTDGAPNGAEEKALRDLERAEADLTHAEHEVHEAEQELEAARREITIIVDGIDHRVRPGKWIVSALKGALGIDPAKVLAEITPQGLKDLDDGAEIELHEKERFMAHARSGGAS